jgi:hypothetical protein
MEAITIVPIVGSFIYLVILMARYKSVARFWLLLACVFSGTTIVCCGFIFQILSKEQNKEKNARAEVHDLESAVSNFLSTERPLSNILAPSVFGQNSQRELIAALMGANPDRRVFMVAAPNKLVNGRLLDPWGRPYDIAIEVNDGNSVWVPSLGRIAGRRVAVWSLGGMPILSWEQ